MTIKKISFRTTCVSIGMALILLSMIVLVFWQCETKHNAEEMTKYIQTLEELIKEVQPAVIEPRNNNIMPSLNIQGNNFIAILELPANNATFPVGSSWFDMKAYPCLYSGSTYDGSLIIGTSNQKGQFEFAKEISVDDIIYVTDMTGDRFSYEVADIQFSKNANNQTLNSKTDELTIFVKNIYAFEYIIIHCNALGF